MKRLANIFWLGTKELRSLASDPVLVLFILYAFTLADLSPRPADVKSEVNNASHRLHRRGPVAALQGLFAVVLPPAIPAPADRSRPATPIGRMDRGRYMFIVAIPPRFEADLRRGPAGPRCR